MSGTLVDRLVVRGVKEVAQRPGYFTKKEVVREVLSRQDLGVVLKEIRQEHPGYGLDQCVVGFVSARVSEELQQRDAYGLRLYECYRDAEGQFRWRRLRSMTRKDLDRVLSSIDTQVEQLSNKRKLYQALRDALAASAETVDAVYERVVTAFGLEAAS